MNKIFINGHFLHQRLTGVQRYAIEVLKGFDRAGYPYEILQPSSFFSSGKLAKHLWQQILLPHQKEANDVLWSPTNTGPIYAKNHIITLHDIGVFPHPEWFSKNYVLWKKNLIPRIVNRARGVLTVSEFSKSIICKYLEVDPHKVKVVYNGVDTNHFKPASKSDIQQVLEKYAISTPYLLTLGSLDPRKNFARLIQAWNQCIQNEGLSGYSLAIAGSSNANFNQFQMDASADTVHFLGYVDEQDLSPLYSGAEGFIFPSLFEGFGLPVIEAMACGTPVITSDNTALDEIAGDAAIKVSPKKINSIKNGIMQLIKTPSLRNSLIERGLSRVEQFNWDKTAEQIYNYLRH